MTARVSSGPITHWWKSGKTLPKLIPPMHRRGMRISVVPSVVYFIVDSLGLVLPTARLLLR